MSTGEKRKSHELQTIAHLNGVAKHDDHAVSGKRHRTETNFLFAHCAKKASPSCAATEQSPRRGTTYAFSTSSLFVKFNQSVKDIVGEHNTVCELCGDEGQVVLCSTCTLSFHLNCLPKTTIKPEYGKEWRCAYCLSLGICRSNCTQEQRATLSVALDFDQIKLENKVQSLTSRMVHGAENMRDKILHASFSPRRSNTKSATPADKTPIVEDTLQSNPSGNGPSTKSESKEMQDVPSSPPGSSDTKSMTQADKTPPVKVVVHPLISFHSRPFTDNESRDSFRNDNDDCPDNEEHEPVDKKHLLTGLITCFAICCTGNILVTSNDILNGPKQFDTYRVLLAATVGTLHVPLGYSFYLLLDALLQANWMANIKLPVAQFLLYPVLLAVRIIVMGNFAQHGEPQASVASFPLLWTCLEQGVATAACVSIPMSGFSFVLASVIRSRGLTVPAPLVAFVNSTEFSLFSTYATEVCVAYLFGERAS